MDNSLFHHIFAMMNTTIQQLLEENARRNSAISQPFDPATGNGAPLPRTCVKIGGYFPSTLFIPNEMLEDDRISRLVLCKDINRYAQFSHQSHALNPRPEATTSPVPSTARNGGWWRPSNGNGWQDAPSASSC